MGASSVWPSKEARACASRPKPPGLHQRPPGMTRLCELASYRAEGRGSNAHTHHPHLWASPGRCARVVGGRQRRAKRVTDRKDCAGRPTVAMYANGGGGSTNRSHAGTRALSQRGARRRPMAGRPARAARGCAPMTDPWRFTPCFGALWPPFQGHARFCGKALVWCAPSGCSAIVRCMHRAKAA